MQQHNLKHLQTIVDETVRTLGGYWAPLSGLARVLEELGELGELLLEKDLGDEFVTELSDVMIITICVANQYCARLDTSEIEKESNISTLTLQELYFQLASDCGKFARIVNSYEGNKKLKPTEHPTTVEKQASRICFDIVTISKSCNLSVLDMIEKTMFKVRKRDKNRFDTLYDPSLSSSHDEYILSIKPNVKIWGLRDSNHSVLKADLVHNKDTIERYLKFGEIEGIHSLVIKVPGENYVISDLGEYESVLSVKKQKEFIVINRK